MSKILLIGAGGHCRVVLDTLFLLKNYQVTGIIDRQDKMGQNLFGVPVVGTDDKLKAFREKGIKYCFITVGSVGDPALRVALGRKVIKMGFQCPNIISPAAVVSKFAEMGTGNFVAPGVVIGPGTVLGNNCIINTGVVVDHDCRLGDYVHLAPGVTISGGVKIGDHSHVGTGACVIQGITIGTDVLIGAGSVVVGNIGNKIIAYGNPCRKVRKNNG